MLGKGNLNFVVEVDWGDRSFPFTRNNNKKMIIIIIVADCKEQYLAAKNLTVIPAFTN